jgi:hypothetical protein
LLRACTRALLCPKGQGQYSDTLPFGRLWYAEPNAISYAKFFSRSHDAVIRIYHETGNVIETLTPPDPQVFLKIDSHPNGTSMPRQPNTSEGVKA